MNYSGTEKMSHVSRPRPCVFSVAGTLWCSQHILHTVWKLCTGNDTPGWGSIHIATMGIPFSHSQSTGCPTPVASRYTTLIFSVPLRTNLSKANLQVEKMSQTFSYQLQVNIGITGMDPQYTFLFTRTVNSV